MQSSQATGRIRVLIACGDIAYGATLENFLAVLDYDIERCHDAAGVLRLVSRRDFDVLVLDLGLGRDEDRAGLDDPSAVDLVSFARQNNPDAQLLLLFDAAQLDRALEGIRQGAFFYLPKSCAPSDVALVAEKAVRSRAALAMAEGHEQSAFEEFAGHSKAMQRVIEVIRKVAPTDSTVLLLGESGTGKEVLANTIHRASARRAMPFVAVNCAALPDALLESEMFGHVKGAFTGADRDKRGLFDEADGGTLFLDEIGDMPAITQAKLLRVLQNGEVRPVGSSASKRVDVRIIAATNQNLVQAVENHRFREDLYFRLNVIQIRVPPLRERMDALPALVRHFILRNNAKYKKRIQGLDEHAASLLQHYEFPGNVRELESILAHAVIMAEEDVLRARDLPDLVQHGSTPRLGLPYHAESSIPTLAAIEEQHIRHALDKLEGNQTKAARQLGISRSTLWRKIRQYHIEK